MNKRLLSTTTLILLCAFVLFTLTYIIMSKYMPDNASNSTPVTQSNEPSPTVPNKIIHPNKDASLGAAQSTLNSVNPSSTSTVSVKQKPRTFPVLLYHAVSNKIEGLKELFVSPEEFLEQMKYLKENNYDVITFDDLENLDNFKKPIIITFDDGYENNYLEAYPILKQFNFKSIIFLTTNFINKNNFLKDSQIKQMTDIIKFESHTLSHPELANLDTTTLEQELIESKTVISTITDQKVTVLAYPSGIYNSKVVNTAKNNYKYAVTSKSGLFNTEDSLYEIKRVYMPRGTTVSKFKTRLIKGSR